MSRLRRNVDVVIPDDFEDEAPWAELADALGLTSEQVSQLLDSAEGLDDAIVRGLLGPNGTKLRAYLAGIRDEEEKH